MTAGRTRAAIPALLVGLTLAVAPGRAAAVVRADLETTLARDLSGRQRVAWQGELRAGRWRCRWHEQRQGATVIERGLTLSGPGRHLLRTWVLGRLRVRTILGTAGFAARAGARRPYQLTPDVTGHLEGLGVELGRAGWSTVVVLGRPRIGSRSTPAGAPPPLAALGAGFETRSASGSIMVACRGGGERLSMLLAVSAGSGRVETRCEIAMSSRAGTELGLEARRLSRAGELRLALRRRQPGAVQLLAAPPPGGPPARHHLLCGWRLRHRAWQLEAQSSASGVDAGSGRVRVDAVRTTGPSWPALETRTEVTGAGLAVRLRLVAPGGRLGWSRAAGEGVAWSGRLRRPLGHGATFELEVRGWRGGAAGRRAAALLGAPLGATGTAAPHLAAAGGAGTIAACRLDLQRTPVRVRLGCAARDVSGQRLQNVASAHVQWRFD